MSGRPSAERPKIPQSIPSRRATATVFALAAVTILIIVAIWVYPGYLASNECPSRLTLSYIAIQPGGPFLVKHEYCTVTVAMGETNATSPYCVTLPSPGIVFHDVRFQLALAAQNGSIVLAGCITTFDMKGSFQLIPNGSLQALMAIDYSFTVLWQPPYYTTGANGTVHGYATCGVLWSTTMTPTRPT